MRYRKGGGESQSTTSLPKPRLLIPHQDDFDFISRSLLKKGCVWIYYNPKHRLQCIISYTTVCTFNVCDSAREITVWSPSNCNYPTPPPSTGLQVADTYLPLVNSFPSTDYDEVRKSINRRCILCFNCRKRHAIKRENKKNFFKDRKTFLFYVNVFFCFRCLKQFPVESFVDL